MAILYVLIPFALIASFTPGPNNILMMSQGINYGFRNTMAYQLGGGTACFLILGLFLLAGGGLQQVIPSVLPVMKYVGCAYLLFLAWVVATSKPHSAGGTSHRVGFGAGFMLQFVNPKYYLYILTITAMLLPLAPPPPAVLAYTVLCALITIAGMAAWAAAGAALQSFLHAHYRGANAVMAVSLVWCALSLLGFSVKDTLGRFFLLLG